MHIEVGIGGPLIAGTIWLLAVVLGRPTRYPGAAVAVLADYLTFSLLIQLPSTQLPWRWTAPPPFWRPGRKGRR